MNSLSLKAFVISAAASLIAGTRLRVAQNYVSTSTYTNVNGHPQSSHWDNYKNPSQGPISVQAVNSQSAPAQSGNGPNSQVIANAINNVLNNPSANAGNNDYGSQAAPVKESAQPALQASNAPQNNGNSNVSVNTNTNANANANANNSTQSGADANACVPAAPQNSTNANNSAAPANNNTNANNATNANTITVIITPANNANNTLANNTTNSTGNSTDSGANYCVAPANGNTQAQPQTPTSSVNSDNSANIPSKAAGSCGCSDNSNNNGAAQNQTAVVSQAPNSQTAGAVQSNQSTSCNA